MAYYTYILRCADGSLYTGITTDLARRFAEHSGSRQGAKYTAARRPVAYECAFLSADRSAASKLEWSLKKLSRQQKEALIRGDIEPEGYSRVNPADYSPR